MVFFSTYSLCSSVGIEFLLILSLILYVKKDLPSVFCLIEALFVCWVTEGVAYCRNTIAFAIGHSIRKSTCVILI